MALSGGIIAAIVIVVVAVVVAIVLAIVFTLPNKESSIAPPLPKFIPNRPLKVIYVDWKPVDWSDPFLTIKPIIDYGWNVINFAFLLQTKPADMCIVWETASPQQKTQCLNYIHNAKGLLMVSAGGATDQPPYTRDPTDYGNYVGSYAANQFYDGIDFDLESIGPGFTYGTLTGEDMVNWMVTCTNAARESFKVIRGSFPYISHAPQAPYIGPKDCSNCWAGPTGGYTSVDSQTQIDFYNVQFYNQGETCYNTYENTFLKSCSDFPKTSIQELSQGIALQKLLLGKPLSKDDAGNGWNSPKDLHEWVVKAEKDLDWNAGIMTWMFDGSTPLTSKTFVQTIYPTS